MFRMYNCLIFDLRIEGNDAVYATFPTTCLINFFFVFRIFVTL